MDCLVVDAIASPYMTAILPPYSIHDVHADGSLANDNIVDIIFTYPPTLIADSTIMAKDLMASTAKHCSISIPTLTNIHAKQCNAIVWRMFDVFNIQTPQDFQIEGINYCLIEG